MRFIKVAAKTLRTLGPILGLLFFLASFSVAAQEKITIGLVPEINVFAQVQRFQPLADYLTHTRICYES